MMKHYVLGFLFNRQQNEVLLIEKKRPSWQAGRWNGIGGKIDPPDDSPLDAMHRECREEIGQLYEWELAVIFTCPGGTVYVYRAFDMATGNPTRQPTIAFEQMEDETLECWPVEALPNLAMNNLNWLIPLCLSTLQGPVLLHDTVKCDGKK